MNEAIYQAHLLDHSRKPRNKRVIENATITAPGTNPFCGDSLTLYLAVNGDVIEDVSFDGVGCAVSQAAASMLTEAVKGKTRDEALALTEEDMLNMLRVEIHASRSACALLAYRTLQKALKDHA